MCKSTLVFQIFLLLMLSMTSVNAQESLSITVLNVRDFGAIGDGKTDDTQALQLALDAAAKQRRAGLINGRVNALYGPRVFVPAGQYRITRPLKVNGSMMIQGDERSVIRTDDPNLVMMEVKAWRQTFEHLTFIGGAVQLFLTGTTDQGLVQIRTCSFIHAEKLAVDIDLRSNVVTLQDCHFSENEQALRTITDMTTLRDCWITTRKTMRDKAAIEARGDMMVIEGLCGVPLVGASGARWIDNYTGLFLSLRDCRFGGEGGGFTTVYNFAKPRSDGGASSILIDGSLLCAGASNESDRAAVYCMELPNKIEIRSCILRDAIPVALSDSIDWEVFAGVTPDYISYVVRDNVGQDGNVLPARLRESATLSKPRPIIGLDEQTTQQTLAKLAEKWGKQPLPELLDGKTANHQQMISAGSYIDVTPQKYRFDVTPCIDGTTISNQDFLAVQELGSDILLMRRQSGKAPYVQIRDVAVDLDQFPYLTLKLKGTQELAPDGFAIKIIDHETKKLVMIVEQPWPPYHNYRAYDLRTSFPNTQGKRTFDIKFYYLGLRMVNDKEIYLAKPGDFIVLDFLRFEADSSVK